MALCKALVAASPEAKAEVEARQSETETANAVKPRTFAEYGIAEAALHLSRILSAHDDWSQVLDAVGVMADRAENDTWAQVLSDVANSVNAEKAEAYLKLLANKNRLMILCNLIDGEQSVSQLNALIPLAQSALSQNLAELRKASMVDTRRDAQTIYYSLADDNAKQILQQLYLMFCHD